jgi:hypothetical protein
LHQLADHHLLPQTLQVIPLDPVASLLLERMRISLTERIEQIRAWCGLS